MTQPVPRIGVNDMGMQFVNLHGNSHAIFHRFPELPTELRTKIWKHALQIPNDHRRMLRVVVRCDFTTTRAESVVDCYKFQFKARYEINREFCDPIRSDVGLLSATHESRSRYLEVFKFSLPSIGGGLIRFSGEDIIYLDWFSSLTWHLWVPNPSNTEPAELPPYFDQIRYLAIGDAYGGATDKVSNHVIGVLLFPKLEEFYLIRPYCGPPWTSLLSDAESNGYLRAFRRNLERENEKSPEGKIPEVLRIGLPTSQATSRDEELLSGCRMKIFKDTDLFDLGVPFSSSEDLLDQELEGSQNTR